MSQYAFFFDETRCIDCHACVVACRDWNNIDAGPVKWLRMFSWETGTFPEVRFHNLFGACYHCEKPLCVRACPNQAIYKEEKFGAVLVDKTRCQGTRKCWLACPYGVPQFADGHSSTRMSKCNMCIKRLEHGEPPICTLSCPTRALDFGPLEEMTGKYGNVQALAGMPDPGKTAPAIIFKPRVERQKVIVYDASRALHLIRGRGILPPLYEDIEAITRIPQGVVRRNRLLMKPRNSLESQEVTRTD